MDSLVIGSTEYQKTSRIPLTLLGNLRIIDQLIKLQDNFISYYLFLKFKILSTSTERSRILEITIFFLVLEYLILQKNL